jgi:hypothetical protein
MTPPTEQPSDKHGLCEGLPLVSAIAPKTTVVDVTRSTELLRESN